MKFNWLKYFSFVFISLMVVVSGCELASFVPKPGGLIRYDPNAKNLDIGEFEANLVSGLGNYWVIYSYVISHQLSKKAIHGQIL